MSIAYDIIIKNATIIDGSGRPGYKGDLAIAGERIAALGKVRGNTKLALDGTRLVVCPGFIDAHSHADCTILQFPGAANLIRQGITTFAGGHCGITLAPVKSERYIKKDIKQSFGVDPEIAWRSFGEFLGCVEKRKIAPNYIPLAGHHALRAAVLGMNYNRPSTAGELKEIKNHLKEALNSGCFGLSVGLDGGTPGHFAGIDELVALVKIVKQYNGIFAPHTRHHQNQWPASKPGESAYGIFNAPPGEIIAGRYHGLIEALEITKLAGNPRLHISHMTPAYLVPQPHPLWLDEALAHATLESIIDRPAAEGMDISYNVIPSEHSVGFESSILNVFFAQSLNLPRWLKRMRPREFAARLKSGDFRNKVRCLIYSGKLKFQMIHPITDPYWMDCYEVLRCRRRAYVGKTIWQIAKQRQPDHTIDAVYTESINVLFDIIAHDPDATWALIKDKRESGCLPVFLQHPRGIPCSDVHAKPGDSPVASPTEYNIFPMFLQKMVKEKHVLSLETAIHKITSFPAKRVFGLSDRGILKPGAFSDIVLLDFEKLKVYDDFRRPTKSPAGIRCVIINGHIACKNGVLSADRRGKVLRKQICKGTHAMHKKI